MDIGAAFDEEFFEKPKEKNEEVAEGRGAKICFPKWYLKKELVGKDEGEILNCLRHQADRYYFKKNYEKASVIYEECLQKLPFSNTQGRRECMENLSRSLLHKGCADQALEWALKMHAASMNSDQKVISWNLLATVCHRLGKYEEELEALHCCMDTHKCYPDLWLRLAHCYAGLFKIDLPKHNSVEPRPATEVSPSGAFNSRLNVPNRSATIGDESQCSGTNIEVNNVLCSENCEKQVELSSEADTAKYEVRDLGIQMVSACLIRTSLLIPTANKGDLCYEKTEEMKDEIATCLKYMNVGQPFIDEAAKMLSSEIFAGLKDHKNGTSLESTRSIKSEVKLNVEDSPTHGIHPLS